MRVRCDGPGRVDVGVWLDVYIYVVIQKEYNVCFTMLDVFFVYAML